jgi:BlaI family transcriptional regulator, penicillinase repressor
MARQTSRNPTDLELDILKVLWEQGPRSGREIQELLGRQRDLTYQSVMTMLGIMEEKGYVTRKKQAGNFVYRARVSQRRTSKRMMRDLVDRLFGGSATTAMLNLLETSDINDAELKALSEMVDRLKGCQSKESKK